MSNYQNPIKRHGDGDLADPFVLRYNGKYYLYCTNPLINCWSSYDLQHWQAEGPVIDENEFPGLVPFAPEVVYWNGFFYIPEGESWLYLEDTAGSLYRRSHLSPEKYGAAGLYYRML